MFCFLETDIRKQKKYEKRIETSVDNTVNDLRYEIKFENIRNVRNIAFLFWTKIYFILGDVFFKIPKNLILGVFVFFAEADAKNHRYATAKTLNAAPLKLTDWIIEKDHVINCVLFFCTLFFYIRTHVKRTLRLSCP